MLRTIAHVGWRGKQCFSATIRATEHGRITGCGSHKPGPRSLCSQWTVGVRGHPGISPLVASVAAEYFPARHIPPGKEPVRIYQSEAFRAVIPPSTQRWEELGYARIHWIDKQANEEF